MSVLIRFDHFNENENDNKKKTTQIRQIDPFAHKYSKYKSCFELSE